MLSGRMISVKCPGPKERCDPNDDPSTRDRGERRYGDDMRCSQAGDGLRDVREEWPAFRMTKQCQIPSGNEIAGQIMCLKGHDGPDHTRARSAGRLWCLCSQECTACATVWQGRSNWVSSRGPSGSFGARVELERK